MAINYNQQMGVYHAIYGRRTTWEFKDELVSRSAIERMLDAAIWAPNHRMTEPWRFVVIERDSPLRSQVALLAYEAMLERTQDVERSQANYDKFLKPAYECASMQPSDQMRCQQKKTTLLFAVQPIISLWLGLQRVWQWRGRQVVLAETPD